MLSVVTNVPDDRRKRLLRNEGASNSTLQSVSNLAYTKHKWQLSRPKGCKIDHLQSHALILVLSVMGFYLSSVTNTFILIILYDFFLLSALFCGVHKIIYE
jgi:hypothetical protein